MNWIMARDATSKSINQCYLYGMGRDLTEDQVRIIVQSHAKIGAALCMLAWNDKITPTKEFVSDYAWRRLQRIEEDV